MTGWKKSCNCSATPQPFPSGNISGEFSAEKLCSLSLCPFIPLGSFSFTSYASFVPLFWIINSSGSKTHLPGVVWAVLAVLVPLMYSSTPLCLIWSLKRCDKTSNATGKYFSIPLGALESSLVMFSVSVSYFHMDDALSSLLQRIWTLTSTQILGEEHLNLCRWICLDVWSRGLVLLPGFPVLLREVKIDVTALPQGSSTALHQRWPRVLVTAYEALHLIDFWVGSVQCGAPILLQPLLQKLSFSLLIQLKQPCWMSCWTLPVIFRFTLIAHNVSGVAASLGMQLVGQDGPAAMILLVVALGRVWLCHTVTDKWHTGAEQ